jgi:phosphoribulokinase
MSARHPIIAITGSSGAGTTTVTTTFQQIFRREGIRPVIVHGDAFHRYDRNEMRVQRAEAQNNGQMHLAASVPRLASSRNLRRYSARSARVTF